MNNNDALIELIKEIQLESYQEGLNDGLKVAEKIADWLNFQPPRKWSQELRKNALKEIEKERKK